MKSLLPLVLLALAVQAHAGDIRFDETQIVYRPGPDTLPLGAQIAVLEGDPKGTGLFTMRVRLPAGSRLPPHWHPKPERVTVLSGVIGIGYGEEFEPSKFRTFGAGSYYVTPPQTAHFGLCLEETVLQVTTEGPWEFHPVDKKRP